MSYQDPYGGQDERFWDRREQTPGWAKLLAVLIVAVGLGAAIAIFASRSGDGPKQVAKTVVVKKLGSGRRGERNARDRRVARPRKRQGPRGERNYQG